MSRYQTGRNQSDAGLQSDEEDERHVRKLLTHPQFVDFRLMKPLKKTPSQMLVLNAKAKCTNPTVMKWLRDNSQSEVFSNLEVFLNFFKEKIEAEEKKDHSNIVDVVVLAHGCIIDVMIPACCLLPLSSIRDVVLYAPWNCIIYANVLYGLATGRLQPHHRVFIAKTDHSRQVPAPDELPNSWNSMKEAGEEMIPNIVLNPLKPSDSVWKQYQSLLEKHGPPGRNRIVIPLVSPEVTVASVPFSVVCLALSLVLDSSRFTATVHLGSCLFDQSRVKFDPEYLRKQYAYTDNSTNMTASASVFTESPVDRVGLRIQDLLHISRP